MVLLEILNPDKCLFNAYDVSIYADVTVKMDYNDRWKYIAIDFYDPLMPIQNTEYVYI